MADLMPMDHAPNRGTPLSLAPAECREEINRTYTMYRYLYGMTSEIAMAATIGFFVTDHRVTTEEVNQALRVLRGPEKMREFRGTSDLMAEFARLVCVYRDQRELRDGMARRREEPANPAGRAMIRDLIGFAAGPRD